MSLIRLKVNSSICISHGTRGALSDIAGVAYGKSRVDMLLADGGGGFGFGMPRLLGLGAGVTGEGRSEGLWAALADEAVSDYFGLF